MKAATKPYTALFAILLLSSVLLGAFAVVLVITELTSVYFSSSQWILGWYGISFFISWWIVYYQFSEECPHEYQENCDMLWREKISNKSIITLRTFLEFNTARGLRSETAEQKLSWKASHTINTVGTIVGISLLILSFTISTLIEQNPAQSGIQTAGVLTAFEDRFFIITSVVLVLQISAVVQFLISVDSLDSSMNEFSDGNELAESKYQLTQSFYVRGVKRYYNGLILFVLSLFLLTMVVSPVVTIVGLAAFGFFGYDYWFGYVNEDN